MKKHFFILVLAVMYSSSDGFSQSLRKCGCQTWRQWNAATPKVEGESRWKRKNAYERYKHQCIITCRNERMKKSRP